MTDLSKRRVAVLVAVAELQDSSVLAAAMEIAAHSCSNTYTRVIHHRAQLPAFHGAGLGNSNPRSIHMADLSNRRRNQNRRFAVPVAAVASE
jgi:hypothetical protein